MAVEWPFMIITYATAAVFDELLLKMLFSPALLAGSFLLLPPISSIICPLLCHGFSSVGLFSHEDFSQ